MMKKIHLLCLMAVCLTGAWAQTPAPVQPNNDAQVRQNISREREAVNAKYEQDTKLCAGKFAVNDCMKAAQKNKRRSLSALRRQEIALNDKERKAKAAEQLDRVKQRREKKKHSGLEADPSSPALHIATREPKNREQEQARYDQKVRSAQEHKQKLERSQRERGDKGKKSADLPIPETSGQPVKPRLP